MADPADRTEARGSAEAAEGTVYGLDPGDVEAVIQSLAAGDPARAREHVADLHPADVADLLECLSAEERRGLVEAMRQDFDPEVLSELDDTVREEIIAQLGVQSVAAAVAELDSDDAVDVIEELEEPEQREVLDAMPAGDRTLIEESLAYPDDSAGRLMQHELVTVPAFWTVGETIDYMRQSADLGEDGIDTISGCAGHQTNDATRVPSGHLFYLQHSILIQLLKRVGRRLQSPGRDQRGLRRRSRSGR